MQAFIFTNQNTFAAFQFLLTQEDRLHEVARCLKSNSQSKLEYLQNVLEEWLLDERPTQFGSFYDQLLEQSLLDLDFNNLAQAIQQLGVNRKTNAASAKATPIRTSACSAGPR